MRIICLSILFMISLNAYSTVSSNHLSEQDQSDLLESIDNSCGDSWCEGDYDYSFDEFSCNFKNKTCEMAVTYIYTDWIGKDERMVKKTVPRVCKFDGIEKLSNILFTDPDFGRMYTDELYHKIDDCLFEQHMDEVDRIIKKWLEEERAKK